MSKILANQIANYGDDSPIEIKEGLNIPAGKPLQAAGSAGTSGQVLGTTGATVQWITPFDGDYNSLSNRPSIPAAQVNSDWNASSGPARILNKPTVPPLPIVTTNPVGSASLSYNSSNGEFTYTPPDLSNASNWDTAYGWGDHAQAGYLTAEADTLATVTGRGAQTNDKITLGDISNGGEFDVSVGNNNYLKIFGGSNEAYIRNIDNNGGAGGGGLNIAARTSLGLYSGGTGGQYITFVGDSNGAAKLYYQTLPKLATTSGGVTITGDIALGTGNINTTGKLLYANNYANTGELPGASTYDGMFATAAGSAYYSASGNWTELLTSTALSSITLDSLSNVDLSVAPTDGQVLKWEASSSSWKPANDLVGGAQGIALSDLSVSVAAVGSANLSYNNTNGVFTYTPPDLSSYLTAETDPVFSASAAAGISSTQVSNWDVAYGWGNHAGAGYLSSLGSITTHTDVNVSSPSTGQLLRYNAATTNWENFTPAAETLATVIARGDTTGGNINFGDSQVARFSSGRLQIYHTGAAGNAFIENTQANLYIRTVNGTVNIEPAAGNASIIATSGGSVALYHNANLKLETTATGATITGALTAGGLTYPTTNGTNGQVLASDGTGNVVWQTPSGGGGGGASVTISDTPPAASAGDLWWESDTGRLKIYYQDTDTSQWVDTSPPLADPSSLTNGATSLVLANVGGTSVDAALSFRTNSTARWKITGAGHIIPEVNAAYDIGSAEYKVRDLYLDTGSIHTEGGKNLSFHDGNLTWGGDDVIMLADLKEIMVACDTYEQFRAHVLAL